MFTIVEAVQKEIDAAERYIEWAHEFKTSHPEKAKLFLKLAKEECKHAEELINFKHSHMSKLKSEDKHHPQAHEAWCHKHPRLCVEIAELKMEIEMTEKSMTGNPY